jgi:hypothetical protein
MEKQGGEYSLFTVKHTSYPTNALYPTNTPYPAHRQFRHGKAQNMSYLSILRHPPKPILTFSVPMQQYPLSPDVTGQGQPPVYHQDPNAAQFQQQHQQVMYAQQPQQPPQQYPPQHPGSPPPQQAQPGQPQSPYEQQQKAYPHPEQPSMPPQQPGMPPQQPSGTVYQTATPIANLGRGPAPADCPACGQRSMTNVAFETGNTTQ